MVAGKFEQSADPPSPMGCRPELPGLYARDPGLYARNPGLQVTNSGLQATNSGLHAIDSGLQLTDSGLQPVRPQNLYHSLTFNRSSPRKEFHDDVQARPIGYRRGSPGSSHWRRCRAFCRR